MVGIAHFPRTKTDIIRTCEEKKMLVNRECNSGPSSAATNGQAVLLAVLFQLHQAISVSQISSSYPVSRKLQDGADKTELNIPRIRSEKETT